MGALRTVAGVLTLAFLIAGSVWVSSSARAQAREMTFFITSEGPGNGASLGGLRGADQHCAVLAARVGADPNKEWVAYLSTRARPQIPAVHARNRIGVGPWYNAKGVMIARSVEDLHSDKANLTKETAITEKGAMVNGRGDSPNMHDILTGSGLDGRVVDGADDTTCDNWTSSGGGSALVGHHDRQGGGANPTSWNSAHPSKGCSQSDLQGTGGNGLFYCFARN
jgi:hypothetical protein